MQSVHRLLDGEMTQVDVTIGNPLISSDNAAHFVKLYPTPV